MVVDVTIASTQIMTKAAAINSTIISPETCPLSVLYDDLRPGNSVNTLLLSVEWRTCDIYATGKLLS
jgi:hypothetical protein